MNLSKYILTIILTLAVGIHFAGAQKTPWIVPAEKAILKNPLKSSAALIEKGKDIYLKNCKSCHGDPGMENSANLNPKPSDPSSEFYQKQSDGEMFYKMTTGRVIMPSFEKIIPENDRWNVVLYVRSLAAAEQKIQLTNLQISLQLDSVKKTISATVTGKNEKGEIVAIQGAEILFSVKRYFGQLSLSENKLRTNAAGNASVVFPSDLPGDSLGNVDFSVKLTEERKFGKVEVKQTLKWATPFIYHNPLDQRAMWGNRAHAPLWIIFSFISIVIGIWGFIIYIVLQVLKIKKAGKAKV